MGAAIIIPARYASSRFPGKPLALLKGRDGTMRPALSYTWQAGLAAARRLGPETLCIIATDDARIADFARCEGMEVALTPGSCSNGTERCAATLGSIAGAVDLVVNLQGDAPLTPASMVAAVAARLLSEPSLAMATAAIPAGPDVLAHLQADAAAGRVGGTTVVCDRRDRALYFSKSLIPHAPQGAAPLAGMLLHLGLYAYRPEALHAYAALGPAPLELQEGLEQLRFLEAGLPVGVAICDPPAWEMIELNNPTDVPLIEAELACRAERELM
ncbi:MAG: manno-octulosonate cytidylyltransferase [Erythrobacter sp.]|jgi:3-deoxy-manno-octulosonate cytidylyltransferase (CMP-KDO synthetase)